MRIEVHYWDKRDDQFKLATDRDIHFLRFEPKPQFPQPDTLYMSAGAWEVSAVYGERGYIDNPDIVHVFLVPRAS